MRKMHFQHRSVEKTQVRLSLKGGKWMPESETRSDSRCRIPVKHSLFDYVLTAIASVPPAAEWVYIICRNKQTDGVFLREHAAEGIGAALFFLVLAICSYLPASCFNFPFRTTEKNIKVQYLLACRLCQAVNLLTGCMYLGLLLHSEVPWASYLCSTALVLMLLATTGYFVLAYRLR